MYGAKLEILVCELLESAMALKALSMSLLELFITLYVVGILVGGCYSGCIGCIGSIGFHSGPNVIGLSPPAKKWMYAV